MPKKISFKSSTRTTHRASVGSKAANELRCVGLHVGKRGGLYLQCKSLVDRAFGGILLVVTSPLVLLLLVLVKLTSKGPGFFRQKRVGLGGRTFEIVKLRSTLDSPCYSRSSDTTKAKFTPVGRIMHRLHLDELPQLYNVAIGEMSFVGPRPERPEVSEKLAKKIDGYTHRMSVKPGVTGLSQLSPLPEATIDDMKKRHALDMRYIEDANGWLEFRILLAAAMRMCGFGDKTVMRSTRLYGYSPPGRRADLSGLELRFKKSSASPHSNNAGFTLSTDSDSGVLL